MKKLILIRHASAAVGDENTNDIGRPLTRKGSKEAAAVAGRAKKAGISPDLIISSPAIRARETAIVFGNEFEYPLEKLAFRETIYTSQKSDRMMYVLGEINNSVNSCALVGHNPLLTEFASFLVADFDKSLPKGAIMEIEFGVDSWSEIEPGKGIIVYFDYPGKKGKKYNPEKERHRELKNRLVEKITTVLQESSPDGIENMDKQIEKAADKLSKDLLKKNGKRKTKTEKSKDPSEKSHHAG